MEYCTFISCQTIPQLLCSVNLFFHSGRKENPESFQNTEPRGPIMLLVQGIVQLFGCNILRNLPKFVSDLPHCQLGQ